MLGDKLGEEHGQTIGMRVLPSEGAPRMETSFQAQGRLLGIESTDIGTYVSVMHADGTIHGEGQGVVMGAGGEHATWRGTGVGTMQEGGGVAYRGALYYSTNAAPWARLNGIAAVYEYDVDAEGKTRGVLWEWS